MSHPYFFAESLPSGGALILDEETSKHVVQVLRMQSGEQLKLTDGIGNTGIAEIIDAHKKHCTVNVLSFDHARRSLPSLTIAISLVKNTNRFEWFLEKATEFGTAEIIPLICERTEKQHYRYDRFANICKSAMLQSEQSWLPVVHHPRGLDDLMASAAHPQKFIAHCIEDDKAELVSRFDPSFSSCIILIGPEGDFTQKEINNALQAGFLPVSLGQTRLRTETAGMYAAAVCRSQ